MRYYTKRYLLSIKSLALLIKIKFIKIMTKKKFILINTSGVAKVDIIFFLITKSFHLLLFTICCKYFIQSFLNKNPLT